MYLKNTKVKTGAYIRRTTKCIRPSDMHLVVRPICSLSHFFYFLFLFSRLRSFFSTQKRKPAKPIPLYFNYNSNPSISFAISLTALLAVQSVYSSAQATQWSYINATRSFASLILALISAIFFSSSFFNSF